MSKKHTIDTYDFNVCNDFIVYIINNDASIFDYSGNSNDQHMVDEWLKTTTEGIKSEYGSRLISYHWSVGSDANDTTYFKRCDITGLYADCINLKLNVLLKH